MKLLRKAREFGQKTRAMSSGNIFDVMTGHAQRKESRFELVHLNVTARGEAAMSARKHVTESRTKVTLILPHSTCSSVAVPQTMFESFFLWSKCARVQLLLEFNEENTFQIATLRCIGS